VHQALRGLLELQVRLDQLVRKVLLDHLVLLVNLGLKVLKVALVLKVPLDNLAQSVPKVVRELLVNKDHKVPLILKEHQVHKVLLVHQELLEITVLLVLQVLYFNAHWLLDQPLRQVKLLQLNAQVVPPQLEVVSTVKPTTTLLSLNLFLVLVVLLLLVGKENVTMMRAKPTPCVVCLETVHMVQVLRMGLGQGQWDLRMVHKIHRMVMGQLDMAELIRHFDCSNKDKNKKRRKLDL